MKYQVDTDGYVLVFMPEHPRAYKSGSLKGYVAEHIVVAERMIHRPLAPEETVHHLDQDKAHNDHTNLLVLENSQHIKLHHWMDRNFIVKKPEIYNKFTKKFSKQATTEKSAECVVCGTGIPTGQKYCSPECSAIGRRQAARPDLDQLGKDITSMPVLKVGEKYGVSDNAIRKWCRVLGLPHKLQEIK